MTELPAAEVHHPVIGVTGDTSLVRPNPLVRVMLAMAGLLAVLGSPDPAHFVVVVAAFLTLCLLLGIGLVPLWLSLRLMLPWTLLFFAIHVGFSLFAAPGLGLVAVLKRESMVLLRFAGLALVMGSLRGGLPAQALVDSLKTLLDRLRIRSRLAEDLLQTVRLILVFIPQVVREYRSLERFHLALGFRPPGRLSQRVRFYGINLLPVMSRSLDRARQLGVVMSLRGYGRVIPRGQLTPQPLTVRDGLATLAIAVLLGGAAWVS